MGEVVNGQRLRAMREAKGWDQRTLAKRSGVNASVISRLERGQQEDVRASVLVALAGVLGTPVDSLLHVTTQAEQQEMAAELAAVIKELSGLPSEYQIQLAAVLRGYLAHLP